ncbi:hypothetical protein Bca52824_071758 [Brassica carinata]|uniref:Cytidine/deoxycytidylate deaminase zinc-binding domain-containing protein n=1 Tax=Brassica carinata TaxID=52824 RepID=A0A8X7Q6E8_BRACI|nr:hypothetical protein Bca52824_071758 [Brassica carinata]
MVQSFSFVLGVPVVLVLLGVCSRELCGRLLVSAHSWVIGCPSVTAWELVRSHSRSCGVALEFLSPHLIKMRAWWWRSSALHPLGFSVLGECGGGKGRGEEWGDIGFVAVGLGSSPPLRSFRDVAVFRQFLQEICDASEIKLIITYPNATADSDADSDGFRRQGSNLPHRFSLEDLLDKDFPLILELRDNNLTISDRDPISNGNTDSAVELKRAALAAANRSYAPYSLCPSGVSLVVVKKMIVVGYGIYLRLILDALATSDWIGKMMCFVRGKKFGHLRDSSRKKNLFTFPGEIKGDSSIRFVQGSEMEEELRDMKAHKAYYNMLHFVANAQWGFPTVFPVDLSRRRSSMKRIHMTTSRKRYFICKDYENGGMHFRQPWVMGMQQEVERLKERFHEQEKLLRECEALKGQVRMLLMRVAELEKRNLPVSN